MICFEKPGLKEGFYIYRKRKKVQCHTISAICTLHKDQAYSGDITVFSSDGKSHKGSVAGEKKTVVMSLKTLGAETN
jgi:hypothetical protein